MILRNTNFFFSVSLNLSIRYTLNNQNTRQILETWSCLLPNFFFQYPTRTRTMSKKPTRWALRTSSKKLLCVVTFRVSCEKTQTCKSICISSNLHEVSFESGISWSKQRTFASINFIALRSSMREKWKLNVMPLTSSWKKNFGAGENLSWGSLWQMNYDLDVVSFVVTHYWKVFSRCKTTNVGLLPGPGKIWWQKFIS